MEPGFLIGTLAYNAHLQNLALALHEGGMLRAYRTGAVDNYRLRSARHLRRVVGERLPAVDRLLARRRIHSVPDHLLYKSWFWDGLRTVGARVRLGSLVEDHLWQRSELELDRRCARLLDAPEYGAFVGVEHGCLATLQAARRLDKRTVLTFLSPHHALRSQWVDVEYERFPELLTAATRRLLELGRDRDQRRDEEAGLAEVIHTNSSLTTRSLVDAGYAAEKMVTVPYGCPAPLSSAALPQGPGKKLRFVYAGTISVRKGAHLLIEAWRKLGTGAAELHLYGRQQLPRRCLSGTERGVFLHGSRSQAELFQGYRDGAILVFPTLCDGFGLVVAEALANGLPVLTTSNAGAADLIEHGRNGFIVAPGCVEALTERMQWCLSHPGELFAMRREALRSAEGRSWGRFRAELRRGLAEKLDLQSLAIGTATPRTEPEVIQVA